MRKTRLLTLILLVTVFISNASFSHVHAEESLFTPDEQAYLKKKKSLDITAYTEEGNMPIQYLNKEGEARGITIEVLEEIAKITGLELNVNVCHEIACTYDKEGDLFSPVSSKYQVTQVIPTEPFVTVSSSVFMNKFRPIRSDDDIIGKRYAEIGGRIKKELAVEVEMVSYKTREETIAAVNRGEADFGISNDFSLIHYTSKGKYDNIITIPIHNSNSDYGYGFINQDEMFMQIINKAINSISEEEVQSIVFGLIYSDINTGVFRQFVSEYTEIILIFFTALSIIFLYLIVKLIKARKQIFRENQHYTLLARNSGELLFEYTFINNSIEYWGEKRIEASKYNAEVIRYQIIGEIKNHLDEEEHLLIIVNKRGEPVHLRIRKSVIYDRRKNPISVFGSIKDVSEEQEYLELLEIQSRTDGLTGLANSRYLKEKIAKRLDQKLPSDKDAFILFDLDNFKSINDTYGHLRGDQVLIKTGDLLQEVFDDAYVIARFGGDEFCVYLANVTDEASVSARAKEVIQRIKDISHTVTMGVTGGITIVKSQENFDVIFKEADDALYLGKEQGRECMVIYPKEEN